MQHVAGSNVIPAANGDDHQGLQLLETIFNAFHRPWLIFHLLCRAIDWAEIPLRSFSSFSCAVFLLPSCQVICTGGRAIPVTRVSDVLRWASDRWPVPPSWMQITSTLYLSCIVVPNINTFTPNMHNAHTWYASEKSRKANASADVYNLRSDPAAHKSTPPSPAFHTIGKPGRGSYQGQIKLTLSVYQQCISVSAEFISSTFLREGGWGPTSKIGKKTLVQLFYYHPPNPSLLRSHLGDP